MTAQLIDGNQLSKQLRAEVATRAQALRAKGVTPGLAVVLVGEDPASKVYVKNKHASTIEVGMASFEHRLPAETSEADLLALVKSLNADPKVHGILVQLPLPVRPLRTIGTISRADYLPTPAAAHLLEVFRAMGRQLSC